MPYTSRQNLNSNLGLTQNFLSQMLQYFSDYKTPPNLGGNGGASYNPNVAYIHIGEILCHLCY